VIGGIQVYAVPAAIAIHTLTAGRSRPHLGKLTTHSMPELQGDSGKVDRSQLFKRDQFSPLHEQRVKPLAYLCLPLDSMRRPFAQRHISALSAHYIRVSRSDSRENRVAPAWFGVVDYQVALVRNACESPIAVPEVERGHKVC
jgi:hypothetical protein